MDNTIEYAAILNDDILWGQDQETMNIFLSGVKREHDFRIEGNNDKGFILTADQSIYSWSIFIINRKAWQTIGEFDENFYPAYFEDCDYKYRAKLAGVPIYPCLKGPCRFVTSGTAAKDRSILDFSIKNRDYFIEKWGGEPGNEVFTTPFGGKNKVGE